MIQAADRTLKDTDVTAKNPDKATLNSDRQEFAMARNEKILAPSILAADFSRLGEEISAAERGGAKWLHFDVMDGIFVPSISFGIPVLESVKRCTHMFMDVHLMITDPVRYVENFSLAGADMVTFHAEATFSCKDVIKKIHDCGKKAGISVKPNTNIDAVKPFLDDVEMILIMSVEPGFGGQRYIPESTAKIKELRRLLDETGHTDVLIEVDGGIKEDNVREVTEAGADIIVAGSSVFKNDPEENTKKLLSLMNP